MDKRLWNLSGLILLLVMGVFCTRAIAADTREARIGDTPTLPTISTLDGKTIAPQSLRGKVTVLAYFASTCPFCMNEAPKLQRLFRDNAERLTVIGVNIERRDPQQKEKAQAWVRKYGLTYPVTTDFDRIEAVLGKLRGIPAIFVFDGNGKLVRSELGELLDEDFDDIAQFSRQAAGGK